MGRGSDILGVFSGNGGVSGRLLKRGRKKLVLLWWKKGKVGEMGGII